MATRWRLRLRLKLEPHDTSDAMIMCPFKVGGIKSSESVVDSDVFKDSRDVTSPFHLAFSVPLRLYWVKEKEGPIHSLPFDHVQESYCHLRSRALQQRQSAPTGITPYDMNVLYQFWTHFLTKNHNTQMYNEFRHSAFEDSAHRMADVGLSRSLRFYDKITLSILGLRHCLARHYVDFEVRNRRR